MAVYWYNDEIKERSIYALIDPRDHQRYVYIGQSVELKQRYRNHLNLDRSTNPKIKAWIQELQNIDLTPILLVLETARLAQSEAYQLEVAWMRVALQQGFQLKNSDRDIQCAFNLLGNLEVKVSKRRLPSLEGLKPGQVNQLSSKLVEDSPLDDLKPAFIRLNGER